MKCRSVHSAIQPLKTRENGGLIVRRPFPNQMLDHFDPFLVLDHLGPVTFRPKEAIGAPPHPHRGFETISYMLEGAIAHQDSSGNAGTIEAGDVQWLTAGSGVVHIEAPSDEIARNGGCIHGFQLWVNLPSKEKMCKPRYQEIKSKDIPEIRFDDVLIRIIAGEAMGVKSKLETRTPVHFLHIELAPGATFRHQMGPEFNCFCYVFKGEGDFTSVYAPDSEVLEGQQQGQDPDPSRSTNNTQPRIPNVSSASQQQQQISSMRATEGTMVLFRRDGDFVEARASVGGQHMCFLLVAGTPLNEPIRRRGPFVMNTDEELRQAFYDYQSGKMGSIPYS